MLLMRCLLVTTQRVTRSAKLVSDRPGFFFLTDIIMLDSVVN